MSTRLIQRHDQFAKHLLEQPGHADAFVRERLPKGVVARLTAQPAVDRSESFIDPALVEHRGDRVFSLATEGGETVMVWTMVEHKSGPETDSLVQTLATLTGIACRGAAPRCNTDGTVWMVPAPVYPIILYHGKRRWPLPTALAQAYPLAPDLVALGLLSFIYTLVDLGEIPDDQLSAVPTLRAGLLILKYALRDEAPEITLERLIAAAAELGLTTVVIVVKYLAKNSEWLNRARIRVVLARIMPGMEDQVLSPFAKEIIAEARPEIIAEARPEIIAEARPEIIAKARPEIIREARPEIIAEAHTDMLLRQLRRRFGVLGKDVVERVRGATLAQLDDWSDRFVDAKVLEDVFTPDRRN